MAGEDGQAGEDGTGVEGRSTAEVLPQRVVWDDSRLQVSFANVVNVVNTREEFTLLFGTNRSWNPMGEGEWKVDLANRITLTPHGAKRLLLLLLQRVQDYEQRFGTLTME